MNKLTKVATTLLILTTIFSNPLVCNADQPFSKEEIDQMIINACEEKNICPELVESIVFYESSYDIFARNGEHYGLMQINPKWHSDRMEKLGVKDLYDPEQNLKVGIDYIYELSLKYNDPVSVLNAYNSGSPKFHMSSYAKKILERSAELEAEREEVYENGETISNSFG